MIAIFKREFRSYFSSILGYLFTAFLLIFAGLYTMTYNLNSYYSNFEYVLESIAFLYLIAVPILTMRTIAEEKRQKTDQLLYSLPIRLSDVVLGKFMALMGVLAVPLAVMAIYPVILSQFGTVVFSTAYASLLAFFLLGSCLLSIGLFISAVTESQVSAAVISLVTMLIVYFMGGLAGYVPNTAIASFIALAVAAVVLSFVLYLLIKNLYVTVAVAIAGVGGLYLWYSANPDVFAGLFSRIMNQLSVFSRFYTFIYGIFDITAIIYFISIIGVFLFLTVQALEKRRWSE